MDARLPDLPLDIILLTYGTITDQGFLDGYVNEAKRARIATDQQALFTAVHEKIQNETQGCIRIFTIKIGNEFSRGLAQGIAKARQGFSIPLKDGARFEKSATRILGPALTPHYERGILEVNYRLDDDDFELIEVTESMESLLSSNADIITTSLLDPSFDHEGNVLPAKGCFPQEIQAPHEIPSLFAGTQTTVYILLRPETIQKIPASVLLRSPFPNGSPAFEIPVEVLAEGGTTIRQLATRKVAQDLEASRGWVFDTNKITDVHKLVEKEAVQLGETFQVINKWCSFVALSSSDGKHIFTRKISCSQIPRPSFQTGHMFDEARAFHIQRLKDLHDRLM